MVKSVRLAEEDCLRKGITSFEDAGTTVAELQDFINLADHQDLNLRLWMMINDSYDHISDVAGQYPKLNIGGQHYLTVRAVKHTLTALWVLSGPGYWPPMRINLDLSARIPPKLRTSSEWLIFVLTTTCSIASMP